MHPFIVLCLVIFPGTPIYQVSLMGPSLLLLTVEAGHPQCSHYFGTDSYFLQGKILLEVSLVVKQRNLINV